MAENHNSMWTGNSANLERGNYGRGLNDGTQGTGRDGSQGYGMYEDDNEIWRAVMKLASSAFSDGDKMPREYTGDGDDISPPLQWSNPPSGCAEYALVVLDPDASERKKRPFVHWLVYDIPADVRFLPNDIPMRGEIIEPAKFNQGRNSFGRVGYNGPLPPRGDNPHHYVFRLYALDKKLHLAAGEDLSRLLEAMDRHVLAVHELQVEYQRRP